MHCSIQSFRDSLFHFKTSLNYNLPPCVHKIIQLGKQHFALGQCVFMTLFGLKELIFDRSRSAVKHSNASKIQIAVRTFFQEQEALQGTCFTNAQSHGVYYGSSGICGGIASLQTYGLCNLKDAFPLLHGLSDAFFCCANWNNLLYHVHCYQEASAIAGKGTEEQIAAKRIKISAVLGIISNVNYLISTATFLFGPLTWLPIIFGGVAMLTGCIKIVYDFFFLEAS